MPLCHYTDAIEDIVASSELRGAPGVFGTGVYFTGLNPSTGKVAVAENNWDGIWEDAVDEGKMQGVIKIYGVKGHDDDFEYCGQLSDRDVWLYETDDDGTLWLDAYQWKAFTIKWNGNYLQKLTQYHG